MQATLLAHLPASCGAERIGKGAMNTDAILSEGVRAAARSVEELIGNHAIARCHILACCAYRSVGHFTAIHDAQHHARHGGLPRLSGFGILEAEVGASRTYLAQRCQRLDKGKDDEHGGTDAGSEARQREKGRRQSLVGVCGVGRGPRFRPYGIMRVARPSIRLNVLRVAEEELARETTKFGARSGRPLPFVAQINLAEVQSYDLNHHLPQTGCSSFSLLLNGDQ